MSSSIPPTDAVKTAVSPAVAPPAADAPGLSLWLRRWLQSNLVVLLLCAFVFFFLLRNQLSLLHRVVPSAVVLGCWQVCFAACVLAPRRYAWLWPAARTAAVVAFVGWQLFFLFVRNPLDFWYTPLKKWCQDRQVWSGGVRPWLDPVDDDTRHYGNFSGIDQNWRMFSPPLCRCATFLAARIEFTDGSDELLLSENEPDPERFFRFGGWRQRKLEDAIVYKKPGKLAADDDLPLCEAYVRWSVRRWRESDPDDERTPARVVLLRRDIAFPEPGADPTAFGEPEMSVVGVFLPDGRLAP